MGNRRLGLLGDAVKAVFEPEAVPVQRGVNVAEVGRLDRHLAVLVDMQRRTRNRAVVAEHPHLGVIDPLPHRLDLDLVGLAVRQPNDLRALGLFQAFDVGAEVDLVMGMHLVPPGLRSCLGQPSRTGPGLAWSPRFGQPGRRRRWPTQPSSADVRVYCQVIPSRYRPGESVTPRTCRTWSRSSLTSGISIHE